MKIKGVTKGKNPGDVVELSADEKVPLALLDAVISYPEFKDNYSSFTREVTVKSLNFVMKGAPIKGMWQNNIYTAEGTVVVHRLDLKKNTPLQPKKYEFVLKFEDSLDSVNLPDLKTLSLVLR